MKKKVVFTGATAFLLLLGGVIYTTKNKPAVPGTIEQQIATKSSATGERIKIGEGLYQVFDDSPELKINEKEMSTNSFEAQHGLISIKKVFDDAYEDDFCSRRSLPVDESIVACLPYSPENYQEFLVMNEDGEVVYKFQTEKNYSFAIRQTGVYGMDDSLIGFSDDGENMTLRFDVGEWSDFSLLKADSSTSYKLHYQTGRLEVYDANTKTWNAVEIAPPMN